MKMSADVEGPVRAIKAPTLIRKFNIGVEAEFSFPFKELSCLLWQTLNVVNGSIYCCQTLNEIHLLIKNSISSSLDDLTSFMFCPLSPSQSRCRIAS